MPYHADISSKIPKTNVQKNRAQAKKEVKKEKMPKINKPSKTLSKIQKEYMVQHSKKHSKEHNQYMIKMMKLGYCIEISHKLAMKEVGK